MSTQDLSSQLPFTCLILSTGLTVAHNRTPNCNGNGVVKEIIDHIDHIDHVVHSILVYQNLQLKVLTLVH